MAYIENNEISVIFTADISDIEEKFKLLRDLAEEIELFGESSNIIEVQYTESTSESNSEFNFSNILKSYLDNYMYNGYLFGNNSPPLDNNTPSLDNNNQSWGNNLYTGYPYLDTGNSNWLNLTPKESGFDGFIANIISKLDEILAIVIGLSAYFLPSSTKVKRRAEQEKLRQTKAEAKETKEDTKAQKAQTKADNKKAEAEREKIKAEAKAEREKIKAEAKAEREKTKAETKATKAETKATKAQTKADNKKAKAEAKAEKQKAKEDAKKSTTVDVDDSNDSNKNKTDFNSNDSNKKKDGLDLDLAGIISAALTATAVHMNLTASSAQNTLQNLGSTKDFSQWESLITQKSLLALTDPIKIQYYKDNPQAVRELFSDAGVDLAKGAEHYPAELGEIIKFAYYSELNQSKNQREADFISGIAPIVSPFVEYFTGDPDSAQNFFDNIANWWLKITGKEASDELIQDYYQRFLNLGSDSDHTTSDFTTNEETFNYPLYLELSEIFGSDEFKSEDSAMDIFNNNNILNPDQSFINSNTSSSTSINSNTNSRFNMTVNINGADEKHMNDISKRVDELNVLVDDQLGKNNIVAAGMYDAVRSGLV